MGICATVKELAKAVQSIAQDGNPNVQLSIEILSLMPLYAEARELGAWEQAYQAISSQEHNQSNVEMLLDAIFEFGRFNLYGAFRKEATNQEYRILVSKLEQHGIRPVHSPEIDNW